MLEHPRMGRRGKIGGRTVIEDLAGRLIERVREIEPSVSEDLAEVASQRGARLVDLATKFKTRGSIVRKMEQAKSYNPGISEKRLRRRVFDALRYTMVCQTESYARTVEDVLADLREKGYEFEDKESRPRDTTRQRREELEQSMIGILGRIGIPPGVKGIGKVVKKV